MKGIIDMRLYVAGILTVLLWSQSMLPLTVMNRTEKELILTLASADQEDHFNTVTIPAGSIYAVEMPVNLSALYVSLGIINPQQRFTTITPYDENSPEWLITGEDNAGNSILVRLLPPSQDEFIPDNILSSVYKKMGNTVVRIDEYAMGLINIHDQVLQAPSFAEIINPASFLLITKPSHINLALFDPKTVKAARAGYTE